MNFKKSGLALILGISMLLTACGGSTSGTSNSGANSGSSSGTSSGSSTPTPAPQPTPEPAKEPAKEVQLNGAGASFPFPLYSKWFAEYNQLNPHIQTNYQSVGSGAGIRQISEGTVDFAGSDAAMTEEQMQSASGGPILHIPTVMGAVVVTYNVPGIDKPLKMTSGVVADLFLGNITKWNDKRITDLNPGVNIPNMDVVVVTRSDGSGTTSIFTNYLSAVSPEWKEQVGAGTAVQWPVGIGGRGNEGVAGAVAQTPGGVGYVELAYAVENNLGYAHLMNKEGVFIEPSIASVTAAAAGAAANMPADLRASLVNADGKDSYPIAGFTWLLVYENQTDADKAKALIDLVTWAIDEGDHIAADLLYSPLPENVKQMVHQKLATIKVNGQPLQR